MNRKQKVLLSIRMKAFEANQRFYCYVGVWTDGKNNKVILWITRLIGAIAFVSVFCANLASIAFVIKFASVNLELTLYAVFQVAAFSGGVVMIAKSFLYHHQVTDIFATFQEFYDGSNCFAELQ